MIRDHLYHKQMGSDLQFRWRGGEVTRLEGIADGVFAITLTLLIVTSAGINGFNEVWAMVRDLPAFMLSFALIMYIWYEHYLFFRRYGLVDAWSQFLNAAFLFVVMILAYPLKLLTTFLWYLIIGVSTDPLFVISDSNVSQLSGLAQRQYMMYFYGAATLGIFGLLLLMHLNAWFKRNRLELDQLEKLITQQGIAHHSTSSFIAILSLLALWLTQKPGVSGVVYFLMPISHGIVNYVFIKRRKHMESTEAKSTPP